MSQDPSDTKKLPAPHGYKQFSYIGTKIKNYIPETVKFTSMVVQSPIADGSRMVAE